MTLQDRLTSDVTELTLPDSARLWVYTANRALTTQECATVLSRLKEFTESWAAHGASLSAESAILLQQIIVLAVDESHQPATGCSIDSSVSAMKSLSNASDSLADLDVLDRSWVLYALRAESAVLERSRLHDFWAMRKAGKVSDEAMIFDSTVKTLGELRAAGAKRLSDSWHAHMW